MSAVSKIDAMSREEKFQLLEKLVRGGIEELCRFAKQHNYLVPPYGRKPDPTPLITENDFVNIGALHCDDAEPPFVYEYGFDPVKFLGQYLVWAHPDSVETRRKGKVEALNRLHSRVHHARVQLEVQESLVCRMRNYRSGIQWGPLPLLTSTTSLRAMFRIFKGPKKVVVQLAKDDRFTPESIVKTLAVDVAENSHSNAGHVDFDNLASEAITYFLRAVALDTSDERVQTEALENVFDDVEVSETAIGSQFTFPGPITPEALRAIQMQGGASEDAKVVTLRCLGLGPVSGDLGLPGFASAPTDALHFLPSKSFSEFSGPTTAVKVTALLGDAFSTRAHSLASHAVPSEGGEVATPRVYIEELASKLQRLHAAFATNNAAINTRPEVPDSESITSGHIVQDHQLEALSSAVASDVCSSLLLWAFRDTSPAAMSLLRAEESAFRALRHDLKRYQKKHGLGEYASKSHASKHHKSSSAAAPTATEAPVVLPPPPVLKLPALSPALNTLLQQVPLSFTMLQPVEAAEKDKGKKKPVATTVKKSTAPPPPPAMEFTAPRMLYRSILLAPDLLVIVLDTRRMAQTSHTSQGLAIGADYLGRAQADWLRFVLKQNKDVLWKLILTPKCFGVRALIPAEPTRVSSSRVGSVSFSTASAVPEEVVTAPATRPTITPPLLDTASLVKATSTASAKTPVNATAAKTISGNNSKNNSKSNSKSNSRATSPANGAARTTGSKPGSPSGNRPRGENNSREQQETAANTLRNSSFGAGIVGEAGLSIEEIAEAVAAQADALNTNAAEVPTDEIVAHPVVATLQRQPSQLRSVQMVEPAVDAHEARCKALEVYYDETDGVFQRSKYSLQHVLATFQQEFFPVEAMTGSAQSSHVQSAASLPMANELGPWSESVEVAQLLVASGIVLVSGGTSSLLSNDERADEEEAVEEIQAPGYVASYGNLSYGAGQQPPRTPVSLDPSRSRRNESGGAFANAPMSFCCEIALGEGRRQDADKAQTEEFEYLPGLEAKTVFLAPVEAGTGSSLQSSKVDIVREKVSLPCCEVSLLTDGQLEISYLPPFLCDAHAVQAEIRTPLFKCRLSVPTFGEEIEGEEASHESERSVHVV